MEQINIQKSQKSNLAQAWLVLVLAFVFGISLAGIQILLGPKIQENKVKETMQKIPVVVLGEKKSQKLKELGTNLQITSHKVGIKKNGNTKYYNYYKAKYEDSNLAGWVVKSSAQGYADKVELLVGFDPDIKKITGLFILDQKETPGLGNKIVDESWRSQFIGKAVNKKLKVVKTGKKDPYDIDAISGATISSVCVTNIINKTVADLENELKKQKSKP